jgi:hypothetical protein
MSDPGSLAADARWSTGERASLAVLVAVAAVAAFPYLAPEAFATLSGYAGDPYIFRLGSAATLGYAVGAALAIADGRVAATRHALVAGAAYSALLLVAIALELAAGRPHPVALALGAASLVTLAINAMLMARTSPAAGARAPGGVVALLGAATAAALFFGVTPLVPPLFVALFGYGTTAELTFRLAGAAAAGYAAMGLAELRSPRWVELRIPLLMALVFNALSCVASLIELAGGRATLLAAFVGAASLAFSLAFVVTLRAAPAER